MGWDVWACVTGMGRMIIFQMLVASECLKGSWPIKHFPWRGFPRLPEPELELGKVATLQADLKNLTGATTASSLQLLSQIIPNILASAVQVPYAQ